MNLVDALIPCMHIIQTIITHACLLYQYTTMWFWPLNLHSIYQGWLFFIRFGFYIKKSDQTDFFWKKNWNRFKSTGFSSVWFGFFEQKPVQTGLARFFPIWVRFFQFQAYKTETEPVSFFKILIGFFFYFLRLIGFLVFFYSPLLFIKIPFLVYNCDGIFFSNM
jgi:hypothetical protein